MSVEALIAEARDAVTAAHVPYSEYAVGAAIETVDGTVFTGCNIEIANYSNTIHAEELAVATAVRSGYTEFERLAVSSAAQQGVTPCGMCRQTLAEFCDPALSIVCDQGGEFERYTLAELFPAPMGSADL